MPHSLCRITVAACTTEAHRAVDLAVPADMHIGQLLPQIVDLVHGEATPGSGYDWRLSRLGELPLDEWATLNDNDVRDGDVLVLTTTEPPVAERVPCDPCHALVERDIATASVLRLLPAVCCVVLGGVGAIVLAWSAMRTTTTSHIVVGACLAVAAAVAAAVARRLQADAWICVPPSLVAVLYAAAVGCLIAPPGLPASGVLLTSAAAFSASILMLRVTDCGRTCLTTIATISVLMAAVAATSATWGWRASACAAALCILSLAALEVAPRLAMVLSGTTPSTPEVGHCHRLLTALVWGSSIAAALGGAAVAVSEIRQPGAALRGVGFAALVALVLLLRVRTHVDLSRRVGLVAAAMVTATGAFTAAAICVPTQAHLISALVATIGAATLGFGVRPTVSPLAMRTAEVVEYVALAAVVPMACWVGGVYGWARGMNLL